VEDAPWICVKVDGFLGLWHMPAGESKAGILTACDRPLRDDSEMERMHVRSIPLNERCPVCRGQYRLREMPAQSQRLRQRHGESRCSKFFPSSLAAVA
jgi:hypothetical protein